MMQNKNKSYKSLEDGWLDITVPLTNGMAYWPTDPKVQIKRIHDMKDGDQDNLTHLSMCAHSGTHMDAPCHFRKSGKAIDKMPLSAAIGKARVIEITDKELITVEEIRPHRIRKGERILFKTSNSKTRWDNKPFMKKFVHLSIEAAKFLSERKVQTIGIDYLSIGGYGATQLLQQLRPLRPRENGQLSHPETEPCMNYHSAFQMFQQYFPEALH